MQNSGVTLPILTSELVRRIERLISPAVTGPSSSPEIPGVVQFGQTVASKARGGKPSNKVFCFSATDLGGLDEILDFYRIDGLSPWFYLTSATFSSEVAAALTEAGFAQREFQQTLLYGVPPSEPARIPEGITIERVTQSNLEEYVTTLADGFEWPDEWKGYAMASTRASFKPESFLYLARYLGEPAGVASFGIREEAAKLGNAAVLPRFRRRGVHSALIHYRLQLADEHGSQLVIGSADFGSGSFRNQHRAGLHLAYIESGWCEV